MYSEYERVKDHRSFKERQTVFSGPLYTEIYEKIEPKVRVVMTEEGFQIADQATRPPPAEEPAPAEEPSPAETAEPAAVTAE